MKMIYYQNNRRKSEHSLEELQALAKSGRKMIIDMAARPTGCHIGGSLSVIDILISCYAIFSHNLEDNKIILSKGHAAAALYSVLYLFDLIPDNPAEIYGDDNHIYTGHPNHNIPHIDFSTGSLGHGVAYAVGHALSLKIKNRHGFGICIMGDGELQEGLCWEAFQIAHAKELNNFIGIVDFNNTQNDGYLKDISPISEKDLIGRFESFGFEVVLIDGHDIITLTKSLQTNNRPKIILAKTIKGKGIKSMEGNPSCHYAVLKPEVAKVLKRRLI